MKAALIAALALCVLGGACVAAQGVAPAGPPGTAVDDTSGKDNVPPGFGTLRQDDIAIRVEPRGLIVRAIPLDESVIRLLTPDSYRTLRDLKESNKVSISAVTRRTGGQRPDLWYVSFYGVEPDVTFSPRDLVITSSGRDFRPLDVIPLSSGFGEERLAQRETQSALLLFDSGIDLDQPLTLTFQTEQSSDWEQALRSIERERALVRARAARSDTHE